MESRNKFTMCRLCLCENECFINIFELNDWQGYVAAEVISDLIQFQVSETDGYPHVVCLTCLTKLTDFRQFKEHCQKSKVSYAEMFLGHGSLVENKPEMVEFVKVKAEPIYYSDNEDVDSKVINDIDGADEVEFKEEPVEAQHRSVETLTHQFQQSSERQRPRCTSKGAVDADSCTGNIITNDESKFDIPKSISSSFETEASTSGAVERSDKQWIPPGGKIHTPSLLQQDASIGKEREGKEEGMDVEEEGVGGTVPGKDVSETREALECYHCGKLYMTKLGIIQHMKVHGFVNALDCRDCGKVFRFNSDLVRHLLTHTGSKPYKCSDCGKGFGRNSHLQVHIRTHLGSKPYKCVECWKSFSQNSYLKVHMRSHTGAKPYKCTECGKSFRRNFHLKVHMRSHMDSRPYECAVCSKSFSQNCDLNRHMRLHTDSKPYKCTECDKCYSDGSNLKKHIRSHMDSKPFKCGTCSKGFTRSSDLRRHFLVHGKEKPHDAVAAECVLAREETSGGTLKDTVEVKESVN